MMVAAAASCFQRGAWLGHSRAHVMIVAIVEYMVNRVGVICWSNGMCRSMENGMVICVLEPSISSVGPSDSIAGIVMVSVPIRAVAVCRQRIIR